MKGGLYFAAALLAGALIANLLLADPGYVALRFAGRLIEMSAVTFALTLLAAYFLVRLLLRTVNARKLWKASQRERREERARRSLARGLLELSQGDWEIAETTLTRHVRDAEAPAAHYLVAARAADLQGATQRREEWLAKALDASAAERAPVLIMQAELHLKHKEVQAAITTLEQLEASDSQNARGLLLLARAYRQQGEWRRLQELEPRLRSTRGIPAALADETTAQIYLDRLKAAGEPANVAELQTVWKDIPKSLAQRPDVVVTYARAAMACDEHDGAETELRNNLERRWDEAAVLTFGELETDEPFRTLERAESWLPDHAEDASLLLTCAQLAARAELYGKARSYLETSIAIRPRPEAYQLLASLMEQLGERDRAMQALNDGLVLALGRKAKLRVRARRWLDRRHNERRRN
ncbi:MAG: heme biosynthesis HemY N-terminal domain-containing protein [Steroidobacter sp.]